VITQARLPSPQLFIPIEVWQKMMAYIMNCPIEVNGFGILELDERNAFTLKDVFITDQVASPGDVEVDPLAVAQAMDEVRGRGHNTLQMAFQWHSHVRMNARFSSTDTRNIENWPGKRLISLVANKFGEYECRLDVYQRDETSLRMATHLVPQLVSTIPAEVMESTALEIAERVKTRTPGIFRMRNLPVTDGTPSEEDTFDIGDVDMIELQAQP